MFGVRALLLTLTIVLSTFTLTSAAQAEHPCTAFDPAVFDEMYKAFGESPVFTGVNKTGEIVTLLLNPETRTFTIIVSTSKLLCETGSGTGGETHKPLAPGVKRRFANL